LGHRFSDVVLVTQALTHRSWCAEHVDAKSNERLEFLGDSILGLVVTNHIFVTYGGLSEGQLAKLRADVVSSVSLAVVARDLGLGEALFLGKGEQASGGREKSSILADGLEAVIGAVYLDGGWLPAQRLVLELFSERIAAAAARPGTEDFKTRLQELVARDHDSLPTYVVRDEGPDHEKHFFAAVSVAGQIAGEGEGRSKKEAEQAAAGAAWDTLEREVEATTRSAQSTQADNIPAEAMP
jgi:ribonuclease-3